MKHVLIALTLICAPPAFCDTCPEAPDHTAALADLIAAARAAPDETTARQLSDDMWAYWSDAPDTHAQDLLDEAITRRTAYDFDGAMIAANALIEYCPDYAEGYNQRAFVNFLRQEYAAALPDLERTEDLSPTHLGALTGHAMTLAALQRNAEAAVVLRRALDLNPWLSERHLLPALEATEEEL
ncbi:MAG: hypothetical protein P1U83_06265 [Roseovarius sp.]|nr:hypothetical protein [Roseovarius sp.]